MKFMLFSSNIAHELIKVLWTSTCIHHRRSVSLLKHGELFMLRKNFFGQIHEGLSSMGELTIDSYQRGRESFINAFSSNMSNVNPKISPNQRSCHVQFPSFHAKLAFTFNIFTGDLYFDALVIGLLHLPSYRSDGTL